MLQQFIQFCEEAYHELRLSSWLSRQEMMGSTVIVIILTIIIAIFVGIIDRILLVGVNILFRIG